MTLTLALSDGRQLAYDTYGDQDGKPVIFSHGFSDSHVIRNPDDGLTASLGVRWIAADQPGVGGSSPQGYRCLVRVLWSQLAAISHCASVGSETCRPAQAV